MKTLLIKISPLIQIKTKLWGADESNPELCFVGIVYRLTQVLIYVTPVYQQQTLLLQYYYLHHQNKS